MVIGGDSCSEGCGFESWHRILDGHFFTLICCKICNDVCLKRPKINNKRPRLTHFLKKLYIKSNQIIFREGLPSADFFK